MEGAVVQATLDETMTNIKDFFTVLTTRLPTGITISFPTEMDQFDETSGELENTHSVTGLTNVAGGGGTSPYSSATGACVTWGTDSIVNGRRLRGRTFLVPLLPATAFQDDGTLVETTRVAIQSAGTALKDAADGYPFAIWARPDPGVTNGVAGAVTTSSVNDKTAILRSRRD
jgi:hypothetical protein